jgi:hypothetical protein
VVLEVGHELIDALLVLGFAQTRQVRIEGGHHRAFVAEINLDLAQVLTLLKEVGGVGMTAMPLAA